MNAIEIALAAYAPEISGLYAAMVRRHYDHMVQKFGPSLWGVQSCWDNARAYAVLVSPCLGAGRVLDDAKLSKASLAYADSVIADWVEKISVKLGELDNAKVVGMALDGRWFTISGTRAGRQVVVDQSVVMKTSSRGLPFCQFPARLYVDGKFTSEAAYKKMFSR